MNQGNLGELNFFSYSLFGQLYIFLYNCLECFKNTQIQIKNCLFQENIRYIVLRASTY